MANAARPGAILHPTDFSAASDAAFAHALKIALARQARFYILHIDREEPEEIDWASFPGVRATLERWGLLELGSPPEAVAARHGVAIRKIDVVGRDPVPAIVDFLGTHPADLIVLATHGREGPARWLHRETAWPVARQAGTPALFLPHGARGIVDSADGSVRLNRVLVPVDSRPRPDAALREAARLAGWLGARDVLFQLLHVGPAGDAPALTPPDDFEGRLEVVSRSGGVVDEIVEAAADQQVGLIAMATEGHRGFLDALRGSTTEQVLRQATCPVLAVPAG